MVQLIILCGILYFMSKCTGGASESISDDDSRDIEDFMMFDYLSDGEMNGRWFNIILWLGICIGVISCGFPKFKRFSSIYNHIRILDCKPRPELAERNNV